MAFEQVVRVFATTQTPDVNCPWQVRPPSMSTGSGVIVDDKLVLTGAHVVAHATFLQVQRPNDPNKLVASLVAICHDADLALLHVDDQRLLDGIEPAQIGEMPALREKVAVVGFPIGGEELSITEGVVSRVEVQNIEHSQRRLLAMTVDAAINSGNSGGPVVSEDRVVGIAIQSMQDAENIGEAICAPTIRHFLDEAKRSKRAVVDIPGIGILTQTLENPTQRTHMGLSDLDGGVLVTSVEYGSSADGVLRPSDVVLKLDDEPVAANGTILYGGRARTQFPAILTGKSVGDALRVVVLRDGERLDLKLELKPLTALVPSCTYVSPPSYFVFAGLVFQVLSRDYLTSWDEWWHRAPPEFLYDYYGGAREQERREVVVLAQVLADEVNVGYQDFTQRAVQRINGEQVRSLAHLVENVDNADGTLSIELSYHGRIVLEAASARDRNASILERYQVSKDRSEDLA